jgi:hypothetical protein
MVIAVGVIVWNRWREEPPLMSQQAWYGTTAESVLRSKVRHSVRPLCPPALSLSGGAPATAVARVYLDIEGRVIVAESVEAPSPAAAEAVESALRQWTFEKWEPVSGRPMTISGKLTFYFVRQGRDCAVRYPSELVAGAATPSPPASAVAARQTSGE